MTTDRKRIEENGMLTTAASVVREFFDYIKKVGNKTEILWSERVGQIF